MSNKLIWVGGVIIVVLVGVGIVIATRGDEETPVAGNQEAVPATTISETTLLPTATPSSAATKPTTTPVKINGTVLAGSSSPLFDFNQEAYQAALKTDKLVVLYFYAEWCPICKREVSEALYPAFNALTDDNIIGFRVNFNDDNTDDVERNLAREFGVAYQHTKVFIKNGQRVLKPPESWDKERYVREFKAYAAP